MTDDRIEAVKPLPCPFCGELPDSHPLHDHDLWMVNCAIDGCPTDTCSVVASTEEQAIRKWNNRAALPGQPVAWSYEFGNSVYFSDRKPIEGSGHNKIHNIRPLYLASPPLPSREAIANILFNERDPFRAAENILALFGAASHE